MYTCKLVYYKYAKIYCDKIRIYDYDKFYDFIAFLSLIFSRKPTFIIIFSYNKIWWKHILMYMGDTTTLGIQRKNLYFTFSVATILYCNRLFHPCIVGYSDIKIKHIWYVVRNPLWNEKLLQSCVCNNISLLYRNITKSTP